MRKFIFTIDENGKLTVEGQGFKGATCLKETEKLLKVVNVKMQSRRLKAEYNQIVEGTQIRQTQ
jgi:hypothetical protein